MNFRTSRRRFSRSASSIPAHRPMLSRAKCSSRSRSRSVRSPSVKRITGKAYDGYAMVMIEFLFGKDLNVASQEVRDAISAIRSDLPAEMKEPIVRNSTTRIARSCRLRCRRPCCRRPN